MRVTPDAAIHVLEFLLATMAYAVDHGSQLAMQVRCIIISYTPYCRCRYDTAGRSPLSSSAIKGSSQLARPLLARERLAAWRAPPSSHAPASNGLLLSIITITHPYYGVELALTVKCGATSGWLAAKASSAWRDG